MIQKVGKAVDEVRRKEHQSLACGDQSSKAWLFRNNPKNLNQIKALIWMNKKQADLVIVKAYQMRLNLQDIQKLNSVEYFQRKLSQWCNGIQSLRQIQRLPVQADGRGS